MNKVITILLFLIIGCTPSTSNVENEQSTKFNNERPQELFCDTYYTMQYDDYFKLTRNNSSLIHDEKFELLLDNHLLKFEVNPKFGDEGLLFIELRLNSDKRCKFNHDKMSKKSVRIYTGKTIQKYDNSYSIIEVNEMRELTSNISKYSIEEIKNFMGDRYGTIPLYEERVNSKYPGQNEQGIDWEMIASQGTISSISDGRVKYNLITQLYGLKYGSFEEETIDKPLIFEKSFKLSNSNNFPTNETGRYRAGDYESITYEIECLSKSIIRKFNTNNATIEITALQYFDCSKGTECAEDPLTEEILIKYLPKQYLDSQASKSFDATFDSLKLQKTLKAI
jgi:hypothetical protein